MTGLHLFRIEIDEKPGAVYTERDGEEHPETEKHFS